MFSDVDNPWNWKEFTFAAKIKKGRYKHHCLPTGAFPVPPNDDGERAINGWKFHYQGWSDTKSA
jgi:hypothetical protein